MPPQPLRLDLFFQAVDAIAHAATVHLQFRFTGAASANAAGQTRERGILSGNQTRQKVLQLGQLYLDLAFARLGTLRKNIEDELGTIDDLQVSSFGKRADLRWS